MGIYNSGFLKSHLVFSICFLCISLSAFAQAQESAGYSSASNSTKGFKLDPDRLVIGGGFGAQFGTVTYVELSPNVGYLVTDNLLAAIGARYIYFQEEFRSTTYKTNIYGGNVFTQYYFLENFVAHAEYELLNLDRFDIPEERISIGSLFVGGGYRSQIGGNSFGTILILYNLNDNIHSPYTNPVIRINLGFGL